jgi:hypothetical protein
LQDGPSRVDRAAGKKIRARPVGQRFESGEQPHRVEHAVRRGRQKQSVDEKPFRSVDRQRASYVSPAPREKDRKDDDENDART